MRWSELNRRLLLPLSPIYGAVLQAKERAAATRRRPRLELPGVTLSVGSLSTGGAGKTPVVGELGRLLAERGYAVRVLSRGYGRRGSGVERVLAEGDARRFGDEPVLLARRGLPVYVGADRQAAGLLAAREEPGPGTGPVFLLDDGFQHRRLARDLDIALLTLQELNDTLLPAGNLREPLTALRRADAVVVREDEAEGLARYIEVLLQGRAEEPLLWTVRRTLQMPEERGRRPLLFCGVARGQEFAAGVRKAGTALAGEVLLRDHQRYTRSVVQRLVRRARATGADGFLTTEKDAVKLEPEMLEALHKVGPVGVVQLEAKFLDERRMLQELIGRVEKLNRRRGRR